MKTLKRSEKCPCDIPEMGIRVAGGGFNDENPLKRSENFP